MAGKAGLVDTAKPKTEGLGHGVLTETEVHDVAVPERKHYEIPLEERMYYATIQRWTYLREKDNNSYKGENTDVKAPAWFRFFASNTRDDAAIQDVVHSRQSEKSRGLYGPMSEKEAYRMQITRQLRNANWLAMFALIVTDVIGPFNAPYAFSTLGFVGGVLLYMTFGIAAIWGSFLLLNLYLRLDSDRFPIRSYGALVEVFFGRPGRYTISAAQILQCLFITATNIIANAQGMSQLTGNNGSPLCFIVSIVIWTVVGCVISVLFRSFKYLSSVAYVDAAVNISLVFITMGFVAHSAPNYEGAQAAYGYDINPPAPVQAVAIVSGELSNAVNGAMNMVFAWSGLMIFIEFMSEMRNPFDFVKSFMGSECVILIIYVMFGAYTYAFQGQYVLPVAFQGVSNYVWQSVGNGLSLWTYTIASVIYLNVAMKVAYTLLFEDLFRGPPLYSAKGRILWTCLQVAAWAIAFVIGTAIPQVQTLQALIGAALLLQFSYTLPPIMQWLLDVRCDAADEDSPYVPGMAVQRKDTWASWARWRRGLFGGRVWMKAINMLIFLAGLATCGLGIWGSVLTIKQTFAESAATSFGCNAPV